MRAVVFHPDQSKVSGAQWLRVHQERKNGGYMMTAHIKVPMVKKAPRVEAGATPPFV